MKARTVRDIMSSMHLFTCAAETSVRDASRLMAKNDVGSIVVLDGDRLLGIFTERDAVKRVLAYDHDPRTTSISEVMTRDPDTVGPDDSVTEAIRKMDEFRYRHLPVVENGKVVGMMSIRDCGIEDLASMAHELEDRHSIAERAW